MSANSKFPWTAFVAWALTGVVFAAPKEVTRTYTNVKYNYRLTFPAIWHISVVPVKAGLVLYNYNSTFTLGQGLFPPGGAEISVLPPADLNRRDRSRSPQALGNEDVRHFSHGEAEVKEIVNPANPYISDVVRVSYDYQRLPKEDPQRVVAFYFRLSGEPFVLGLNYWKDDSKGALYERTLLSILKSIRPVRKSSRGSLSRPTRLSCSYAFDTPAWPTSIL